MLLIKGLMESNMTPRLSPKSHSDEFPKGTLHTDAVTPTCWGLYNSGSQVIASERVVLESTGLSQASTWRMKQQPRAPPQLFPLFSKWMYQYGLYLAAIKNNRSLNKLEESLSLSFIQKKS